MSLWVPSCPPTLLASVQLTTGGLSGTMILARVEKCVTAAFGRGSESPEDPPEWTWFPDVLFNLDSNLRDTAFLLQPDIIQLTSLASTDEHLFIPEHSMDALIAARVHFDTLSLVSSRSVERPPSQLCPDASSSQDPTDSADNPPSSKCPRC
ncbi:hypothetical protein Bca101_026370 [Brassica carinata]